MKKLFLVMCVAFLGMSVSAQGKFAAGVNLGVAPCLEKNMSVTNFGIGAKLQYYVTDPIRVEANLNYGFKDKGLGIFDASLNGHYLFSVTDKIKVYPIVGLGYAHLSIGGIFGYEDDFEYNSRYSWSDWDDDEDEYEGDDDESASNNKFMFNVGAGAEYSLTENLSVGIEVKYQCIKDFNRLPISLGVTYRF